MKICFQGLPHTTISLIVALFATMAMFLAGCNGSPSSLSGSTNAGGEYDKIGVTVQNNSTTPPTYSPAGLSYSAFDNAWVANPKSAITLSFFQMAVGSRGGIDAKWDYSIFVSTTAENYNDPVADMATFTHKIVDLPTTAEHQTYTWWTSCRALVRAYEPGTRNQADATFVNIVFATPEANVRTQMFVTSSVDANGVPLKTATISLVNLGLADANDVTLRLGDSLLPNTIEAATGWNYGHSVSGPVVISPGMEYQIGGSTTAIDGESGPCSDSIITSGLALGTLSAGGTIQVYATYK